MEQQQAPVRVPWWILVVVGLTTIMIDQVTKWLVIQNLDYRETWVPLGFLEGIFDFTYIRNTGAAFGMAENFGNVFLIIAVLVTSIIVFYYRQLPAGSWPVRISMGLMLGGALGNAIDRLRLGYVVDFFHLHGWPIFNIADSAISVGVVSWLIFTWWEERVAAKSQAPSPATDVDVEHDTPLS